MDGSYAESMKAYFSQFGKVADCVVMKDKYQDANLKRNRYNTPLFLCIFVPLSFVYCVFFLIVCVIEGLVLSYLRIRLPWSAS